MREKPSALSLAAMVLAVALARPAVSVDEALAYSLRP